MEVQSIEDEYMEAPMKKVQSDEQFTNEAKREELRTKKISTSSTSRVK